MPFRIFRRLNYLLHFLLLGVLFFIVTFTTSAQSTPTDCTSPDNLVINGCFEDPELPTIGLSRATLVSSVPGWTLEQLIAVGPTCPNVEFDILQSGEGGIPSYQGSQFGKFDNGCTDFGVASAQTVAISQVIATTPFHTYEVSFAYRRLPAANPADSTLIFEWNNIIHFNQPAPAFWEVVTFEVIAESNSTEIYFADPDIYPDASGTVIDDIRVTDLGPSCVIDPSNLVTNGCFEAPHVTEPIFQYLTVGQLPGWTMEQLPGSTCWITLFEVQYQQDSLFAYEGEQFGEFESGCDSGFDTQSTMISQIINTQPNHRYQVSFAGSSTGSGTDQFIRVEWNDRPIFEEAMSNGWATYTTEVIADGATAEITFSEPDDTPDFVGSVIDDIRVVDLGPVAPVNGELLVQKDVDWLGTPVNMAVEFEICITGPSYPSGNCYRFDGDGGTFLWENLLPGNYTVLETLPGNDWIVTQPANPVIVSGGEQANAYVLNTLATGSIHATKSVNWNGVEVNGAQTFTLCINSDLLGNVPNCQVVGANGGLAVWDGLVPGTYNVYEFDPGSDWSVAGGGPLGVMAGQVATTTITNTRNEILPPPPTCVHDLRADLTGVLINGDTSGRVTNNGTETCTYPIGLASYSMYDNNIDNQIIFDATTASVTLAPGQSVDIGPISLPSCSAQVDLFYGGVISPQFYGDRYGGRLLVATIANGSTYCTP
ncbi:MAG: DUF642 domain-containing protein [Aggregatilineales bacterium]